MAVIQISKIQIRRGVADSPTPSGLPQLSSGELGWAIDEQRLWIGSGAVSEGAPAVSNVEILTAAGLTSILQTFTATNYTYKLDQGTGGGALGAVQRSIQEKLDDNADALDFGIMGDGVTDDTSAIQGAINALYLNNQGVNDGPRLNFHPGNFIVSGQIYIPPYAKLIGSGIDKTTFTMVATGTNIHAVFSTVGINSSGTAYVTTANINSTSFPRNIELSGITFQYTTTFTTTQTAPLLSLDSALFTSIENCKFTGAFNSGYAAPVTDAGVQISNQSSAPFEPCNVVFDYCTFENLSFGITCTTDIDSVKITRSKFKNNSNGLRLGYNVSGVGTSQTGPKNWHITDNIFENIDLEAINSMSTTTAVTSIISSNNLYKNNIGIDGLGNSLSPIIAFNSPGNKSINDTFDRFDDIQPVADLTNGGTTFPIVDPTVKTQFPFVQSASNGFEWKMKSPYKQEVYFFDPYYQNVPLLTLPYTGVSTSIIIDYVATILLPSGGTRTGKLYVNVDGLTIDIKDDFTFQGTDPSWGGITFTGSVTNNAIQIEGTTPTSGYKSILSLNAITLQ